MIIYFKKVQQLRFLAYALDVCVYLCVYEGTSNRCLASEKWHVFQTIVLAGSLECSAETANGAAMPACSECQSAYKGVFSSHMIQEVLYETGRVCTAFF